MLTFASFVLLPLLFSSNVFGVPGIPHQFYGYVYIDDLAAEDGTLIEAKIDGKVVASTTTLAGRYGYAPHLFFITDPDGNRAGKQIDFYVNGVFVTSYTFENGASTRLDLYATSEGETQTCSDGTPYGECSTTKPKYCDNGALVDKCGLCGCPEGEVCGSDGSCYVPTPPTGGAIGTQETNVSEENLTEGGSETCVENWSCTEWSECSPEGIQTRECIDLNSCGTEFNKPEEVRNCIPSVSYYYCGDGICSENENCNSCPEDCGTCELNISEGTNVSEEAMCGNGVCEPNENCSSCPVDCKCLGGYECRNGKCILAQSPQVTGFLVFPGNQMTIVGAIVALIAILILAVLLWKKYKILRI